jgi:hypothetical protein
MFGGKYPEGIPNKADDNDSLAAKHSEKLSNVPTLLAAILISPDTCKDTTMAIKVNITFLSKYGAGSKIRTRDLLITSELLYQLSYAGLGLGGEIRTPDPLVPNQMRYQTALHRG